MRLNAGEAFGGYVLESLVGRGGMGSVWLATDANLRRRVALKLLAPELARDEHYRARFIAESRMAASLDHPNIVPIFEAGEVDGQPFIAMRYVAGRDLASVIADGPLPADQVVNIVGQVASALDAAHEIGLVHRDVKPANILLTRGSEPGRDHAYLSDFGLAKDPSAAGLSSGSGHLLGTVGYIAPEQINGQPIDRRADVYSLGCVTFESLAGGPPYRRETELAVLMAHVDAPPPSLAEARPELPAAVDTTIARALAKNPDDRFPSAGDFARALSAAVSPTQSRIAPLTRGFLFADLRGYTDFVESRGDRAAVGLLDDYRALVRDVTSRTGGAEIRTEGDSFYLVFPSASSAVGAGLEIARAATAASTERPDRPIQVGIGVHAGESAHTDEGYVGLAVNTAARLCAIAHPGEVLVSETVRSLTRSSHQFSFTSRGRRSLKGIAEPVVVYAAGLAEETTPTSPSSSRRPSLPAFAGAGRRKALVGGLAAFTVVAVVAGLALAGIPGRFASGTGPSGPPAGSGSSGSSPGGSGAGALIGTDAARERIAWYAEPVTATADSEFAPCAVTFGTILRDARLWIGGTDGKGALPVLPMSDIYQRDPAWDPTGRQIVFAGDDGDLWHVSPDGANPAGFKITGDTGGFYSSPAVGVDGRIVTTTDAGTIVIFAPDGSVRDEVLRPYSGKDQQPGGPPNEFFSDPTWVSKTRLAFIRREDGGGGGEVDEVETDGSLRHLAVELLGLDVWQAAFSPDGQRLAVIATSVGSSVRHLYLMKANGTEMRQVAEAAGETISVSWSPDSSHIAIASNRDGPFEIYTSSASGTDVKRLTTSSPTIANCSPAWGTLAEGVGPPVAPAPPVDGIATIHRGVLDPGRYRNTKFTPRFTVAVPSGWLATYNAADYFELGRDQSLGFALLDVVKIQAVSKTGCIGGEYVPIGQKPADLIAFLRNNKHLKSSGFGAISVGPYAAQQVTISLKSAPSCPGGPSRLALFETGAGGWDVRQDEVATMTAIDVNGDTVTIISEGEASAAVVRSIAFEP